MPSQFETRFSAGALARFYDQFGRAATYTAPDGTVTAGLTVRRNLGESREAPRPTHADGEMQTAEILVRQSELARPVPKGRFAVEGAEAWTIATTPQLKNGEFICTCSRSGVERLMPRRSEQ